MWMDVVDLRDFYASDLGQMARRLIRRRIRAAWPDTHGLSVLGLGYAVPFLHPFRAESTRVIAAMPATIRVDTRYSTGRIAIDSRASISSLIRMAPS